MKEKSEKRHNSNILFIVFIVAIAGIIVMVLLNKLKNENMLEKAYERKLINGEWKKYSANPIIGGGKPGSWDEFRADPFVMKEDGIYKMWFAGHKPPEDSQQGEYKETKGQIGYAESQDGINWKIYPEPVLQNGPEGSYDFQVAEVPNVIKNGNIYEMWYSGKSSDNGLNNIFHATSNDGINWIKDHNNPVIKYSQAPNAWDSWGVLEPTVIKENNLYKMWYTGIAPDNPANPQFMKISLGYATSYEGSHWEPYSGNPIIHFAKIPLHEPASRKAAIFNTAFFVLNNGKEYELWYMGGASSDIYATSKDGINWRKYNIEILPEGKEGEWDSWSVNSPSIIIDEDGTYEMWYMGWNIDKVKGIAFGIGYAKKS